MINYNGLTKAEVLMVLYNNAVMHGLGILLGDTNDMTLTEAETLLKKDKTFNYLRGRTLLIDLSSDDGFDSTLYDKYNGDKAAEKYLNYYLTKGYNI